MDIALKITSGSHIVDVLGNVKGRDQPIMLMEKALELVSLIGKDVLINDNVVYFDPFCKAGEILLACAMSRLWHKDNEGTKPLDILEIQHELYESNRYFAMAPDERHHRLSLRTFLGNENSHKEQYNHIIKDGRYLSEINGRLDEEKFKMELKSMLEYIKYKSGNKRIIAVGNPPYQESDGGGGKSAKAVYQLFVEYLMDMTEIEQILVVIPSRWFIGGKGLDQFRKKIINSTKIKNIKYFINSSVVFPTVDINGGICYLHYDRKHEGPTRIMENESSKDVTLSDYDIIPDDIECYNIIQKISKKWKGEWVSDIAWSRNPFGIISNFFQDYKLGSKKQSDAIPCIAIKKELHYVSPKYITKNQKYINLYKVCVSKAAGGSKGKRRSTIPKNLIFIVKPGTITTETYSVINTFKTLKEAENMLSYLQTSFSLYLVGLRKITQNISKECWQWLPYMDMTRTWSDNELFKFFNVNKEEQKHIKEKIKEWS